MTTHIKLDTEGHSSGDEIEKHELLVFIGRFQPFHLGHKAVVDKALASSERVLILIGGAGKARSPRNPFTFEERKRLIMDSFNWSNGDQNRLIIKPLSDTTYNDNLWTQKVQEIVNETVMEPYRQTKWSSLGINDFKIGLIGCEKDHTSYYLNLFPQWDNVSVEFVDPINATDIRKMLYKNKVKLHEISGNIVTSSVADKLFSTEYQDILQTMGEENAYYEEYRNRFPRKVIDLGNGDSFQYEIQHNTVDACIVQSGHVLLIRRRSLPGKGLYAMPGGFTHANETFWKAMVRELKEETGIKLPEPVLRGSLVGQMDADDPNRSERGCIRSKVFHIALQPARTFPKVKGMDDADKAIWLPLSELREDQMFEDHYHIIRKLTGV